MFMLGQCCYNINVKDFSFIHVWGQKLVNGFWVDQEHAFLHSAWVFFPNSSFGWFLFNSSVFPRFSPISSCDVGCVGKTKSGKSCRTPIGNLVCNKLSPHVCQFFFNFQFKYKMIRWSNRQSCLQQAITLCVPVFSSIFKFGKLVCNKLSPHMCQFFLQFQFWQPSLQ